jgi:hypothetical protein
VPWNQGPDQPHLQEIMNMVCMLSPVSGTVCSKGMQPNGDKAGIACQHYSETANGPSCSSRLTSCPAVTVVKNGRWSGVK